MSQESSPITQWREKVWEELVGATQTVPQDDDAVQIGDKPMTETMEAITSATIELVEKVLQPHIDYCQQVNGLPYCKNCSLNMDELRASLSNLTNKENQESEEDNSRRSY